MMFADRFAAIATAMAERYGGPYVPGVLTWPGEPVRDDGGSIVTPGTPASYDCQVQVDSCTEAMRREAGYTDKDVRLIVLAPNLSRAVDTDAIVTVLSGPHVGEWTIQSSGKDVGGFAYDGRGRRA